MISLRPGFSGVFSLALVLWSQVVIFFNWKRHYLSEKWLRFYSNDDIFAQIPFINKSSCHLMTSLWQLEQDKKKNHKIRTFFNSGGFFFSFSRTSISILPATGSSHSHIKFVKVFRSPSEKKLWPIMQSRSLLSLKVRKFQKEIRVSSILGVANKGLSKWKVLWFKKEWVK